MHALECSWLPLLASFLALSTLSWPPSSSFKFRLQVVEDGVKRFLLAFRSLNVGISVFA